MNKNNANLADRIRQAVEQSSMSATDLATRLEMSRAYVSHWMTGRRVPSPDQLESIAAILRVDTGWLRGDTAGPARRPKPGKNKMATQIDASPGLLGTLSLGTESAWLWRDAPEDGGRDYGNPNVFATPPDLRTLVRETGQNAVDASESPRSGGQTHLRYSVIELTYGSVEYRRFTEALRFHELREHITTAAATESKLGSRLRSGLGRLDEEGRLVLLRIDDYGTTGLFGEERTQGTDEKNPFAALCRNNLDSSKLTTSAGGSFGLGKAVLWRCSDLSTVVFASDIAPRYRRPGQHGTRLIGKAELTWHHVDKSYAGPGWFSRAGSEAESLWVNDLFTADLQLDRSDTPEGVDPRRKTGTSILIVGFRDPQGQDVLDAGAVAEAIARAAAENFWPLMIQSRLQVSVERWRDGEVEQRLVVDPRVYLPEMCETLERHYANEVADVLLEPGDVARFSVPLTVMRTRPVVRGLRRFPEDLEAQCQLLVRLAASDSVQTGSETNSVALVRGRGMVVRYWPQKHIVVGGRPFHAVLLAGEAVGNDMAHLAAEQFLRASEPPAHDRWEYNDELRDNYSRGTGTRLREFWDRITDALRRAIRPVEEGEEQGPAELRRLLRLATGIPQPPPPVTIRRPSARIEDGAWVVEGEIHVNDRTRQWRIVPRLSLAVESGAAIRLPWDHLEVSGGEAEQDGVDVLLLRRNARRVRFRGRSAMSAEGIPAAACRLKLDLRVDEALE